MLIVNISAGEHSGLDLWRFNDEGIQKVIERFPWFLQQIGVTTIDNVEVQTSASDVVGSGIKVETLMVTIDVSQLDLPNADCDKLRDRLLGEVLVTLDLFRTEADVVRYVQIDLVAGDQRASVLYDRAIREVLSGVTSH